MSHSFHQKNRSDKQRHHRCLIIFVLFFLVGCKPPSEYPPHVLPIHNQEQAKAFTQVFFKAYLNHDVETVISMVCEKDQTTHEAVKSNMNQLKRKRLADRPYTFEIRSIIPMWIGREPYYRIELSFPLKNQTGQLLEAYRIRVRDGCVEGFVSTQTNMPQPTLNPLQINGVEEILLPPNSALPTRP